MEISHFHLISNATHHLRLINAYLTQHISHYVGSLVIYSINYSMGQLSTWKIEFF